MLPNRKIWLALQAFALLAVMGLGYAGGPEAAAIATAPFALMALGVLGFRLVQRSADPLPAATDAPAERDAPASLGTLILVGALLHVVLALALDLGGIADSLTPDHRHYRHWGKLLVENAHHPISALQGEVGYNPTALYYYLNAVAWFLVGSKASLLMGLVNGGLHLATALLASRIAHQVYGAAAGRMCFILVAFFPSLVVYSSVNIRDSLSWFLIALALRGAMMARDQGRAIAGGVLLSLGLAGMGFVRPYIMLMLLISIAGAQLLTRPKRLPYAIATLMALVLVGLIAGPRVGVSLDMISYESLREIQNARLVLDAGGSAGGLGGDVSTPLQALLMLPKGLAFFLLSPFPWQISNARQALAVPEVLLWLGLLVVALRQVVRDFAVQPTRVATLFLPALAISLTYALMEGNAGTANRHRGQMAMVVMVFASQPLAGLGATRRQRAQKVVGDASTLRRV